MDPFLPFAALSANVGYAPFKMDERNIRGRPISRILSQRADPPWITIPLGLLLPTGSSCQPGRLGLKHPCGRYAKHTVPARRPYLALLPVGLAVPVLLPVPRWALTPPFHHDPRMRGLSVLCGAVPRVAPAGRYPAPLLDGVRTFLAPGIAPSPRLSSHPRI